MRNFTNGAQDRITIADNTPIDITGTQLTLFCWILPDLNTGAQFIFSKNTNALGTQYFLKTSSTTALQGSLGGDTATSAGFLSTALWPVGLVKNGTGADALKLYGGTGGTERASITSNGSISAVGVGLGLGSQPDGSSSHMLDGNLGEVAIWDVGLTPFEMQLLCRGVRPSRIRQGNLRLYMPIWGNQATANPEADHSGSKSLGSISASPDSVPSSHPRICSVPMVV